MALNFGPWGGRAPQHISKCRVDLLFFLKFGILYALTVAGYPKGKLVCRPLIRMTCRESTEIKLASRVVLARFHNFLS